MYQVSVYDEKMILIDKFIKKTFNEAMTTLATNYGHNPKYDIRKVKDK